MSAKQEIAARFTNIVTTPPPDARRIPGNSVLDDYFQERFRKEIPQGCMTLITFEPEAVGEKDGPMGLAVPSHGIEVFTYDLATGRNEQTFFGLRPDKKVDRAHLAWLHTPLFPFTGTIEPHQSSALVDFAEDPHNPKNQSKLVIARQLPLDDERTLQKRLAEDAERAEELNIALTDLHHVRVIVDMNRLNFPLN